jgi:hypothetical protein
MIPRIRYDERVEIFLLATRREVPKMPKWRFSSIRSEDKPLELIFKHEDAIAAGRRNMSTEEKAEIAAFLEPLTEEYGVTISSRETAMQITVYSVTTL